MQYIDEQNPGNFTALDPLRVLVFDLEAEGAKDAATTLVHSSALTWVPLPGQEAWVEDDDKVFLVHPDILLTKLGPGQKLKLRAIAVKGIGAVHTKWSPVSSCYYEMKTSIRFTEPVRGEAAHQLQQLCPETFSVDEKDEAVVIDASKYTKVLDCLRPDAYPAFADKIAIEKDKTCVRFYLESTGQLPCAQIFRTALQLFAERCRSLSKMVMQTEVHPTEEPTK
ncbi:DNA-directed RNA polymerases I and III subunit RPAC1 [Strigomonas culicis]|uniref:Plastid-encoded RNA polymerase subunit alpha n=1 Tax=Strigomonas culicis TaxID=28005 RepID=S9VL27_9TRYP|nr:DNA-directed RNA polymerases I and III subunit RPAC1 [Strigomonas culicis]EPY34322.1 DNA-directed RNA polymerases I and III subunit RPAC1 [Strigomonas culicis]|eukprot:EPY23900.1 DNA-directed RNA polymerases I and III subunit RPAC1 [Strigomonas culicis]